MVKPVFVQPVLMACHGNAVFGGKVTNTAVDSQELQLMMGVCTCRCFAACPRCTGDSGHGSHCKRKGKFFNCRRNRQQVFFGFGGPSPEVPTTVSAPVSPALPTATGDPPQPVSSSQPPPSAFPFPPSPLVSSTPSDADLANRARVPEVAPTPFTPGTFESANPSSPIGTTPQPTPVPDRFQSPTNVTPENTLAASVTAPSPFQPPPGVRSQSQGHLHV